MSDAQTLKIYAERASDYAGMIESIAARDPLLRVFIDAIPAGGNVLDLGCGPGTHAAQMARAGLQVTACDPVPQMVEQAAKHPGVDARVASFDDLSDDQQYDGIWVSFSLLHAAREDVPRYLGAIHRALRPGGRCHIGVKTGTGTARDGIGRRYTYFETGELLAMMRAAGFRPRTVTHGIDAGLSGEVAPWVCVSARA